MINHEDTTITNCTKAKNHFVIFVIFESSWFDCSGSLT